MDPYKILGVAQNATKEEIERAYRTQARRWHPDVNHEPGAEDKFKNVQLAHAQLTGKAKRPRVLPPRPPAPTPSARGNGEFYATQDAYDPWNRSSGFYPSPGGTEQTYRDGSFHSTFDQSNKFRSNQQDTRPQPNRDGHTKPDSTTREQAAKKQQADAIYTRGREQAEGLKQQGLQKSEEILADARKTVADLKTEAFAKAKAIKDRAEAKAEADRARINRELDEASRQMEAIRLEFADKAQRIDGESRAQATAVRKHAEYAAATVLRQAANDSLQAQK